MTNIRKWLVVSCDLLIWQSIVTYSNSIHSRKFGNFTEAYKIDQYNHIHKKVYKQDCCYFSV